MTAAAQPAAKPCSGTAVRHKRQQHVLSFNAEQRAALLAFLNSYKLCPTYRRELDMFRPKLLFTSLAALALGACSPQDPQALTSAAIAKQVILPTYSRWVEADRQLAVSALAYSPRQGEPGHRPRRLPPRAKPELSCNLLLIGPLAEGNRSWQVQFWPDKRTWWAVR